MAKVDIVMPEYARWGTTNLNALLSKSSGNRQDMEDYGNLRWTSGSWVDSAMDLGKTKELPTGEICTTCFTTKALTGECGYCD